MKKTGQIYQVNGSEPILLDDLNKIWIIQRGSIALFAVRIEDGVATGNRRYLCSLNQGEALFGTNISTSLTAPCTLPPACLIAVPIGETELVGLNQQYFGNLVASGDAQAIVWIEIWLQQLSSALSCLTIPAIQVKATSSAKYSLLANQTLQSEVDICWLQLQQGSVRLMGFAELTLNPETGLFPLSQKLWLEAPEASQIITTTTAAIRNDHIILNGLSQFNNQLLQAVAILDRQETEAEVQRLRDRQRLNRQVTAEALGELASTLNYQDGDFFLEGTPLLVAAGAVGRGMGVKISPPGRSENLKRLKEPLEAIVRASHLRMRRVLLRDNWWQKDGGALVAYTREDNRPMALLPISADRYEIFDPVDRTRTHIDAQIASTLNPVAYMFYRSLPNQGIQAWELLQFALKNRGRDIIAIILASIAITLLGMLTPQATAILIDHAIPDSDRSLLLQVGLGLLVAGLGVGLFQLAQGFAILRIETSGDASTQAAVWDRLLNLPVSFFRQYTTGDLLSRTSSISTIRRQLSGRTLINLISSFFALFYLGQLFYYNFQLALVALAVAIITIAITTISGMLLLRKVKPLLEVKGDIFGQVVQLINGISKLHIAGAQERAFAAWSKNYTRQVKLELSTQTVEDTVALFNTVMPILTSGILFWFTVYLLQKAQTSGEIGLSLGTFLAFNTAFISFTKGTTDLSNTVTEVLQVIPQWQRAKPILGTIPEVTTNKADPGKLIGRIEIDRVTFRYRQDGALILDDVSISAEPGEFIALVGSSGSGKSTLLRLLLGFETPETGTVYYDGQDLSGLDVEAVRRQLGVVLQNGQLTSASIFENIAGGAQITLDEAWSAAQMAGLAEDIAAMPMEMHTVISEGSGNISGGQRQRLLIARALALKPRILLFDEATSALDNKTQAIVTDSLNKLQVTRIAIAHRLSTIRNADRIYVLQAGRIVQQGSFRDLAGQDGLFSHLMARQQG
jgi:NHLM bacteriocin system ABC transporter ATP-binding protein